MSESSFVPTEHCATKSVQPGKKRGRKSKKEIEEASLQLAESRLMGQSNSQPSDNIQVIIQEKDTNTDTDSDTVPGTIPPKTTASAPKKRGRKPKGGKIVQPASSVNPHREVKPNVVLHLKCSLKELNQPGFFSTGLELDGYSFSEPLPFNAVKPDEDDVPIHAPIKLDDFDSEMESRDETPDIRDVWKKLKVLEHNLHVNNVDNKKSACFWDTCEFDNPPVYIPKCVVNGHYHVYGCFCSPECAVAHLMEENIDSSVKFERYCLLNHVYGKACNYQKNIKPAPNPYYMLEKFCGNLTTQEYRSLLRNDRLFLVVDKPLTRIMPELHEDNDDFIINHKIIPSNTYQVKKKMSRPTKSDIMNERFGATTATATAVH